MDYPVVVFETFLVQPGYDEGKNLMGSMKAAHQFAATEGIPFLPLTSRNGTWHGQFHAMASPCELLVDGGDREHALALLERAQQEALRIERKFSRYRDDNIVHAINSSKGKPVTIDAETSHLLEYAAALYQISDGRFDITSGVLRRVWKFDGSDQVPTPAEVAEAFALVGWPRVQRESSSIALPAGMEIDLGGIGKEYAVDHVAGVLARETPRPFLLNFGGDLYAHAPRRGNLPWSVGLDDPDRTGEGARGQLALRQGAVATSGDARRYLLRDGRRYGHILDARTGWPVENAPRSVTVLAPTCVEAGMLATLAMLYGGEAEAFLHDQGVRFYCIR